MQGFVMKRSLDKRVASRNPLSYIGPMQRKRFSDMPCPTARALDLIGERWTLLVIRDVFRGIRRFDELQESLGIARNILTQRLAWLIEAGIIEKRAYAERPPRFEYRLTQKGRDLFPVIIAIMQWGQRWSPPEDTAVRLVDRDSGAEVQPMLVDGHTGKPLEPRALRLEWVEKTRPETQPGSAEGWQFLVAR
jgi:DNA-binding HxlR family transcriptional regulator